MTQYPICQHVKTNGSVCESPALRDSVFCYFHQRDRQRLRNLQQAREVKLSRSRGRSTEDDLNAEILESLQLPLLEDPAAIQVVLTNVARAIAGHHIAERRAALLLYSLQIAVSNVARVRTAPFSSDRIALNDADPIPDLNPLARPASWLGEIPAPEEQEAS
jgi:hypothetical protein